MTPAEFRAWRAARGWTQRQAAEALGMSCSQIEDYESGRKRGTDRLAPVPRVVELACEALAHASGCDCEYDVDPDDPNENAPTTAWHYHRACRACGGQWWGVHCPHDGSQTPCPHCGVTPAVVFPR